MRIITGTARGTHLDALEGEVTRPTSDRVKEAIFSMLQFDIEGRVVLDLFAGSGQLALEALSRGAAKATLIDQSRDAVEVIIANAKKTHLFDRCRISASDYTTFVRGASGREKYDIVFLDPPYNTGLVPAALKALADGELFARGAHIVCETDCELPIKAKTLRKNEEMVAKFVMRDVFGDDEALAARFNVVKSVLYGRVRVTVLEPIMPEEA